MPSHRYLLEDLIDSSGRTHRFRLAFFRPVVHFDLPETLPPAGRFAEEHRSLTVTALCGAARVSERSLRE